jgi:hypothetical protein
MIILSILLSLELGYHSYISTGGVIASYIPRKVKLILTSIAHVAHLGQVPQINESLVLQWLTKYYVRIFMITLWHSQKYLCVMVIS